MFGIVFAIGVTEATMARWRIDETPAGLRLAPVTVRGLRAEPLTWADLLHSRLEQVKVYVLYFPSRFDLELDTQATEALRSFGLNSPASTSVSFWDPTDPEFSRALGLFDLRTPPALVFVAGMRLEGIEARSHGDAPLYAIAITDQEVLRERERLASAANTIHEIIARGNPQEIAAYLRQRQRHLLLEAIGTFAGQLRDQFLKLKPKLQLPGGPSLQLG
jgi:hypothetical protein